MKKILVFMFAMMVVALSPTSTNAQGVINLFSGSIGGPSTEIKIINGTSDNSPLLPSVANQTGNVLWQGQEFQMNFGTFSQMGQIPIEIRICKSTQPVYRFNSAPEWPDNISQPEGLPITDDYLRARPSKDDLKRRVNEIKNFMHDQPGGNQYASQMKDWLRMVSKYGIATRGESCTLPIVLPAITFNYAMWNSYGGNTVTMLTIVGDRTHGYSIQNPPRWVQ